MSAIAEPARLEDFTDVEIRREYEERFGEDVDPIEDYLTLDLIEELERRDALPVDDVPLPDEVLDLIAEAARNSPHAARAYELLRAERPQDVLPLRARQSLIEGRMGGLPI